MPKEVNRRWIVMVQRVYKEKILKSILFSQRRRSEGRMMELVNAREVAYHEQL